jgi:hypothetical protein
MKKIIVCIPKVNEERRWIWIRIQLVRGMDPRMRIRIQIRPKCYGSPTLLRRPVHKGATGPVPGIGAVSYGWSSQLREEQSATGGAVSYGWGSQLREEQSATGGAVSYGWSSQLQVEQAATGGAVSYGWSSQL